jgi:hypothetical protein
LGASTKPGAIHLLAGVADPRIRRTPRHWTDIDRHYQALRLEMMALFADIGIACG